MGIYGGFHKWGYPHSWMVYRGKTHTWMITRGTPTLGNPQRCAKVCKCVRTTLESHLTTQPNKPARLRTGSLSFITTRLLDWMFQALGMVSPACGVDVKSQRVCHRVCLNHQKSWGKNEIIFQVLLSQWIHIFKKRKWLANHRNLQGFKLIFFAPHAALSFHKTFADGFYLGSQFGIQSV